MTYKPGVRKVFLLLLGLTLAPAAMRAEIVEQILVKVNGEIFTKSDLEGRQVSVLRQRGEAFDIKNDPSNQQLRKALDEITPRLIVSLVDDMLLAQRGTELGYKLTDEQFKQVLENIRKENKLEREEEFLAALQQEGLSMADLRRNLERQMITQRVQQNEVFGKVSVSEEETRAYYTSHLNEFTTPSSVTLREVLVTVASDDRGVNAAQDEAAAAKAEQIRTSALAGESIEKLAADLSDAPSKANGGLIGPIGLNDLSPDLRTVIEALKVGDTSPVLRTPRGYQILKLESSTPTETLPFEVAREQISDRVGNGKRQQEFAKYMVKLRSQAIIEWKNEDIKKAYLEGLKQVEPASPPR